MSNNQQQKEVFKWSEENQVLMDPFAPRKVPNYEYSMPESSPSDKESEMEVAYQPSGLQAPTNHYGNNINGHHYDSRYYAPTHYGGGSGDSATLHYNGGGGGGGGDSHAAGPSSEKRSPSTELANSAKHDAKRIKLERNASGDAVAAGKGDGVAAKGDGGHGGKTERQEGRGGGGGVGGEMGGMRRYRREANAPRGHRDSCGSLSAADHDMKPGSLPIHRSVIDDLKRRISDIKRAVRNGGHSGNTAAANYAQLREHDWNLKVLAFLETNLAHAEHTNHYLSVKC